MNLASVAVVLAVAVPAHADDASSPKPDPAAIAAGDANLESTSRRKGKNFTAALGGGLTVGFGIADTVGNGGSFCFRLGHVATERTVVTAEIAGVVVLHRVAATGDSSLKRNEDTSFLLGAQYYVNRSLWVRAALGLGRYVGRDLAMGGALGDLELAGPAGAVGGGLDLVRLRRLAFGVEMMSTGMINREGFLSSNAFMLNVSVE